MVALEHRPPPLRPLRRIGSATSNFSLGSSTPQARPLRTASASSRAGTTLPGRGASLTLEDGSEMTRAPSSPSSAREPGPGPGEFSREAVARFQGSSVSLAGDPCGPVQAGGPGLRSFPVWGEEGLQASWGSSHGRSHSLGSSGVCDAEVLVQERLWV